MNCLCRSKQLFQIMVTLAIGWSCASLCHSWSLVSQPTEGLLVLKNGNILRGKVQQLDGHYLVYLPNGELRVREQQVDMFCRDLEEAYQRRRAARGGSSADTHLELAGWCLRHELYVHARVELEEAAKIDAEHPRLALLQRQLRQSIKLTERKKRHQPSQTDPAPELEPIDDADLAKAPQWARALFVRQIQPLMVHSCAAGGCHQSGSHRSDSDERFVLNRLATSGAGHPEATLRNLAATLGQIDWETSENSELLRRAKQAHGSADQPPLEVRKLQVLQSWISQLTEVHRRQAELRQLKLLPPTNEIAAPAPAGTTFAETPSTSREPSTAEIRQASFSSTDPFDPAKFNNRYATRPSSADELTVPHVLLPGE